MCSSRTLFGSKKAASSGEKDGFRWSIWQNWRHSCCLVCLKPVFSWWKFSQEVCFCFGALWDNQAETEPVFGSHLLTCLKSSCCWVYLEVPLTCSVVLTETFLDSQTHGTSSFLFVSVRLFITRVYAIGNRRKAE